MGQTRLIQQQKSSHQYFINRMLHLHLLDHYLESSHWNLSADDRADGRDGMQLWIACEYWTTHLMQLISSAAQNTSRWSFGVWMLKIWLLFWGLLLLSCHHLRVYCIFRVEWASAVSGRLWNVVSLRLVCNANQSPTHD